jgi:hypothetical protein
MTNPSPPTSEEEIDLCDLLRKHGYGVVEGADEVRKKIKEIGEEDAKRRK